MSYCAIENVLADVRQLIDFINDGDKHEVNEHELESAKQLVHFELDELKELLDYGITKWERDNK
tara:strand:+ start:3471 stop:3662 length:192 start_codon:yes stop_codon:yes gene_type:complete